MNRKLNIKKITACAACFVLAVALVGGAVIALGNNSGAAVTKTDGEGKLVPLYTNKKPVVLGKERPEVSGSAGRMSQILGGIDTLKEAYEEAELVVDVVITDWLGEDADWRETFFKVSIRNVYKNTIGYSDDELVFGQWGYSNLYVREFPLYNVGDRLFLCLSRADEDLAADIEKLAEENVPGVKPSNLFFVKGQRRTELWLTEIDGVLCAYRSNLFQNFNDVPSSFSESEIDRIAVDRFGVAQSEINSYRQSNNIFLAENGDDSEIVYNAIVFLTIDDLLSYLYAIK